jgi:hypothetical protein
VFLPTVLEETVDPKVLAVHDCEFRKRLAPNGAGDHWWWYGTTDREASDSVDNLVSTYSQVGSPWLARFSDFPGPFAAIAPDDLARGQLSALPGRSTICRAALTMARICSHRSLFEEARRFIDVGLNDLEKHPGATAVQRRLLELRSSLAGAG